MTRVTTIQFEAGPESSIEANVERAMDVVRDVAPETDVACLPEYFSTDYFPAEQDADDFELAQPVDGQLVTAARETAAETDTALVIPFFELAEPGGRYYNAAAVVARDGSLVGTYRKLHPFQRRGYNETYYFAPGNTGVPVFDVAGLTVAIMICYDRHFPEMARVAALRGADLVFVPTCSFGEENRDQVWQAELTGIAVANSLYVAGVNRAGTEHGNQHFGGSAVVDPSGADLGALGPEPGTLTAEVDPAVVAEVRQTTKHLNDVREELLPDMDKL